MQSILTRYPDIASDLLNAISVKLVGTDFLSYLIMHRQAFRNILAEGGELLFIGCEPNESVAQTLAFRSERPQSQIELKMRVDEYIQSMNELKAQGNYNIRLKLLPYVSTYALLIIRMKDGSCRIYVKTYTFKGEGIMPTLAFTEKDEFWMGFWEGQFEKMWECGENVV
jgi:hypothetical protein